MLNKAAELFDCEINCLKEFEAEDAFNDNNLLSGVICIQSTHRYGSIIIFKVNNIDTDPQLIWCTPKLQYPFKSDNVTDERKYRFPSFKKVHIYEKLDGTNICAYSYCDSSGKHYVTYKTRLTPVARENSFANFASLWTEILDNGVISTNMDIVTDGDYTLSFELYGYKNPHLIQYDTPLSAKLLFAVKQSDHSVIPPGKEMHKYNPATLHKSINNSEDLIKTYEQLRIDAQAGNKHVEDHIEGIEGYVLYVLTEDNAWLQYKLKPEMIEDIHWANTSINIGSIYTTVVNALENVDVEGLTYDYVTELLREEYSDSQISLSATRILSSIERIKLRVIFRDKVSVVYHHKFSDNLNKKEVMPYMSKHFEKSQMRDVFTCLKEAGILLE